MLSEQDLLNRISWREKDIKDCSQWDYPTKHRVFVGNQKGGRNISDLDAAIESCFFHYDRMLYYDKEMYTKALQAKRLESRVQQLSGEVSSLQSVNNRIAAEYAQLKTEHTQLKATHATTQLQKQQLEAGLQAEKAGSLALNASVQELESRLGTLSQKYAQAMESLEASQQKEAVASHKMALQQLTIGELEARIEVLSQEHQVKLTQCKKDFAAKEEELKKKEKRLLNILEGSLANLVKTLTDQSSDGER